MKKIFHLVCKGVNLCFGKPRLNFEISHSNRIFVYLNIYSTLLATLSQGPNTFCKNNPKICSRVNNFIHMFTNGPNGNEGKAYFDYSRFLNGRWLRNSFQKGVTLLFQFQRKVHQMNAYYYHAITNNKSQISL